MPQTPFLGELLLFAGNFAPRGYAFCAGQLLPIAQNTALFSIVGTTYGGNGTTTFGLPDLRSRITVGEGQGPQLSPYNLGQTGGQETHTLDIAELPQHQHLVNAVANGQANGTNIPGATAILGTVYANETGSPLVPVYSGSAPTLPMDPSSVGASGNNQPHENRMPYLALNWCIALTGIFPTRN